MENKLKKFMCKNLSNKFRKQRKFSGNFGKYGRYERKVHNPQLSDLASVNLLQHQQDHLTWNGTTNKIFFYDISKMLEAKRTIFNIPIISSNHPVFTRLLTKGLAILHEND